MNLIVNRLVIYLGSSLLSFGLMTETFSAELGGDYTSLICPQSLNIPDRPFVDAELDEDDTYMTADEADLIENGISTLSGNAEITRNTQQVTADTIVYNQPEDTANLDGNVNYWDVDLFLNSEDAFLKFDNGVGEFTSADYILKESRGRGSADKMVLDIGTRTDLEKLEYTTCDPDDQFWNFTASSLSLDHEKNYGKARNVVIRVKDVPVFYTPYLSFALSKERKTGFLAPGYGNTNRNGFEFRTPYYWNISPNMDATLTPRLLTDSGVMAMGEYRYLHNRGSGEINLEYLPSDNGREDKHRNFIDLELNQRFASTGNLFLTYSRVSDKFYFEDFGSQLSVTSTSFLEQRADITYSGSNWWGLARVQNFQTVNRSIPTTSRPYKRLPQILFNYNQPKRNHELNFGLTSEVVYFDRGENTPLLDVVNGARFDLNPYVSFPMTTAATFIEPKLSLRYTQYALNENSLFESSPNRVLPIFSLDSGIFLERDIDLFNTDYIQTLEPRLFYRYTPHDGQEDLPVFDSGLYTFSFDSLFYPDRFAGPDRVGDANQVTLAVTSQLIKQDTGQNIGSISFGQIFYFRDRKVTLPGLLVRDQDTSSLVAAFNTNLIKNTRLSGDFQWNPYVSDSTEKMTLQVAYNPAPDKIINFAYRVVRSNEINTVVGFDSFGVATTDIDQTDLSFSWPIKNNWSVVGRWNYAVPEGRSLELFGGVEYESCCWGVRAVARRFLSNVDGAFDTGIFLQMELKGLAGIGKKTVDFLKQQIPGYQSEF